MVTPAARREAVAHLRLAFEVSERGEICSGKAPDELVRLTGSLELISHDTKAELTRRFLDIAVTLARAKRHCAPYLAALGLLLNRTPLYAGPETVVSPDLVERAYSAFQDFDWTNPELLDLQNLFLRAKPPHCFRLK